MMHVTELAPTEVGAPPALRLVEPVPEQRAQPDLAAVNPRLLRCFLAVATERHFSRAADRLFVAQSALSRSIRHLETQLDRPLFVRTTRTVHLTPSGELLLDPAREVLDALDALTANMAGASATLRIAHPPGSDIAALILDELSRAEPDLPADERAMHGCEQLAALRDGMLDVAICRAPERLPHGLRAELIRLDALLVAVIGREAANVRRVDPRSRSVATPATTAASDPDLAAFVRDYERVAECSFRRVAGVADPGTEAYAMRRSGAQAFVTLASRGVRIDAACRVAPLVPVQGYFPWSVVWRPAQHSAATRAFISAARRVSASRRWLDVEGLPGDPWLGTALSDVGSTRA